MGQGNFQNSTDFTASCKVYTVFHVRGCFKSSINKSFSLPSILSSCFKNWVLNLITI